MGHELITEPPKCIKEHRDKVQAIIEIKINNIDVQAIVDTGATVSVMSMDLFRVLGREKRMLTFPVNNCKVTGAISAQRQIIKLQVWVEM